MTRVPTGRTCACGEEIQVTEKTAAFGATHGRDPKTWPARCAYCILDTTIAMFSAIGKPEPLDVMPDALAPPKPMPLVCGRGEGPCSWTEVPDRHTALGVQLRCLSHGAALREVIPQNEGER